MICFKNKVKRPCQEEDHRERRRNALLTFLDLLCSYFPDHLPGPSKNPRDCRESLCHLGWLLQDQSLNLSFIGRGEGSM